MRRAIAGVWPSTNERLFPALLAVGSAFLIGALLGFLWAMRIAGGDDLLRVYMEQFMAAYSEDKLQQPPLSSICWRGLCWPMAVLLVSCAPFRLPGIPAVFGLRGLLLSFSAASFARACGGPGLEVAFLFIGLPALLAVPALFLLGAQCFSFAWCHTGKQLRGVSWNREQIFYAAVCVGMNLLSAILEARLCPMLISGISEVPL